MEDQSYYKGLNTGVSDGTHSGNRGVQENYRRQAQVGHEAQKLGETLTLAVVALFVHPAFCFVGFWLIGFGLLSAAAPKLGLSDAGPWYGWTAALVPLVLAVLLRKIVRKLMIGIFAIGVVTLVVAFVMGVIELRQERAARAAAPTTAAAPTAQAASPTAARPAASAAMPAAAAPTVRTAPPRAPTPANIRQALQEAARSEVTSTPPAGGGGEFERHYCAAQAPADRPDWCP